MTEAQNSGTSARGGMVCRVVAAAMGLTTAAGYLTVISHGNALEEGEYLKLVMTGFGMLFAFLLFVGCCFSFRGNARQGRIFAAVSALLFLNILLSGVFDALNGMAGMGRPLLALQTATSILAVPIYLLFWFYQCAALPENRAQRGFTRLLCCLGLSYAALQGISLFTGLLFYVDGSGRMCYPGEVFEIVSTALFYLIYLLYILPQRCSLRKKLSLAAFAVIPLFSVLLAAVRYASGLTYGALSSVYLFLLLAAYVVFLGDYIESRETILRQKAELAEQTRRQTEMQTALTLSQVRPHFLYNALTAIRNLCKLDSMEAYTALGSFSDYLRGNMDALGGGRAIPFEKELAHVRTYLALEQLRFGEDLRVEFDIRYQDFSLPALTVQPIVENAVRHGAAMNEAGGVVTIRAEKTAAGAVIRVSDNGPGFDPCRLPADGKTHYGLANVRACLSAAGCGKLELHSAPAPEPP